MSAARTTLPFLVSTSGLRATLRLSLQVDRASCLSCLVVGFSTLGLALDLIVGWGFGFAATGTDEVAPLRVSTISATLHEQWRLN